MRTSRFGLVRAAIGFSASAVLSQAVGLLAGLWIAGRLGPSEFGIWNAVSLVLTYGAYAEFGVLSAMGRDLPFLLGKGDEVGAASLEAAARWATVAGAFLVAVTVIGISSWPHVLFFWPRAIQALSSLPSDLLYGLRLMAVMLVFQQVYTYQRTLLRGQHMFGELGAQQVIFALTAASLGITGVVLFGLQGRLLAAVVAQGGIVVYAVARTPWRTLPMPKLRVISGLVRTGVPITIVVSIIGLVKTVDRPMVLAYLGTEQLGYFSLATLVSGTILLVPTMANQVLYPRISYRFGQSGGNLATLRQFVLHPPVIMAYAMPILIGPVYFATPAIVHTFLPSFSPGIPATRFAVAGVFFFAIVGLADYFLVTTRKLKQYAVIGIGALALNIACDYTVLRLGYGIEGVALAGTAVTYFAYSTVVIGYSLSHFGYGFGGCFRYFTRLWLPFGYMIFLLWSVEELVGRGLLSPTPPQSILVTTVQVVCYLVGVMPLALLAWNELRLDVSLKTILGSRVRG